MPEYQKHPDVLALKAKGYKYESRGHGRGSSFYYYYNAEDLMAIVDVYSNGNVVVKYYDREKKLIS